MKSGGWAKGRKETKLVRVDNSIHEIAKNLSLKMRLPITKIFAIALHRLSNEYTQKNN